VDIHDVAVWSFNQMYGSDPIYLQSYVVGEMVPAHLHHMWVADFTYIPYRDGTREIVGMAMQTNHAVSLVLQSLFSAVEHHARPTIFHSDNGREYGSRVFTRVLAELGIFISRSAKSSPWENGYQEAFYSQFKIDLGDPNRFKTTGELVYEIHRLGGLKTLQFCDGNKRY
jgi:transposase InsO family protein